MQNGQDGDVLAILHVFQDVFCMSGFDYCISAANILFYVTVAAILKL